MLHNVKVNLTYPVFHKKTAHPSSRDARSQQNLRLTNPSLCRHYVSSTCRDVKVPATQNISEDQHRTILQIHLISVHVKQANQKYSGIYNKKHTFSLMSEMWRTEVGPSVTIFTARKPDPGRSFCLETACSIGTPVCTSWWHKSCAGPSTASLPASKLLFCPHLHIITVSRNQVIKLKGFGVRKY